MPVLHLYIATPLTNLTKKLKRYPEKVVWDDTCEGAFQKLKAALVVKPVLKVANLATEPFVLHPTLAWELC